MVSLSEPRFSDEDAAREHIEASRWPDLPFCPLAARLTFTAWAARRKPECSCATVAVASSLAGLAPLWSARIFRCTSGFLLFIC